MRAPTPPPSLLPSPFPGRRRSSGNPWRCRPRRKSLFPARARLLSRDRRNSSSSLPKRSRSRRPSSKSSKKMEGSPTRKTIPPFRRGRSPFRCRIARTGERGQALPGSPPAIGVGFLTGTPEAIAGVFKLLGIRSRYAITTELKQFGYDFFLLNPDAFAPAARFPVGPEYVLGPGDEVRVTIWGKIEGRFNLFVDRDGMIRLPKVGAVRVAGR